jgi:hypothetical protein
MQTNRQALTKVLLSFLVSLIFFTSWLFEVYQFDPNEYCDFDGIYYQDAGKMYQPIKESDYSLTGMEYAYVCNINDLHLGKLTEFENITRLGVTRGNVGVIGKNIKDIKKLDWLQVQDQEISWVPKEIGEVKTLKYLNLSGNNITDLPEELGDLDGLETFYVYDNQLSSLPDSIGRLKNLKVLDIHSNQIASIPFSILELSENLEVMYLGENRLTKEDKNWLINALPKTKIYF